MVDVVMGVVCELDAAARVELERALTLTLQTPTTAAQRRWAELGTLAQLLESDGVPFDDPDTIRALRAELRELEAHRRRLPAAERPLVDERLRSLRKRARERVGVPVVSQALYDERRPPGSPPGETLARRYGTWLKACRAAYGLQPDGSTTGPGRPWAVSMHAARGVPLYTREGCLAAVARCARALLRRPTSSDYVHWQRAQRARQPGRTPAELGLPDISTVLGYFGSWRAVLAALPVTDHELAQLRATRVPNPAPNAADANRRRSELLGGQDPRALPLSDVVALATAEEVSLEWLTGDDTDDAGPPRGPVLDPAALRNARGRAGVRDLALARAAKLTAGQWRQAAAGRRELTLGQLIAVAKLLRCRAADLLTVAEDEA
ncbi:hypothetical protein C7Y72_14145 [Paraconexibacter algicola]|uniref:Uncharacterized protein n=2 Tax=Paraconexibacter algicola TaxID=2133960 RepID=A0A2T4UEC6_9ACTN|nr:hypothetical protein C7Y72_14145 [Paraconexibacter algicola]